MKDIIKLFFYCNNCKESYELKNLKKVKDKFKDSPIIAIQYYCPKCNNRALYVTKSIVKFA